MNKRPHPGLGLPPKPYTAPQPGPAPPLPAGPPPQQQQQQYTADNSAAWAAYYQSMNANPTGPGAQQQTGSTPGAANPYANYGYGAGAPHVAQAQNNTNQPAGYQAGGYNAGYGGAAQGSQGYPAPSQGQYPGGPGYTPGGGSAARPPPPHQQQQQNYSGWGQGQQPQQQGYGGGYGPPPQQPYQPPMNHGGGNFSPQHQQYRPGPAAQPNRPYQPQPQGPASRNVSGAPSRPPGGNNGPGGGFPPAKRPRFDGPGNNSGGPLPPRPPPPQRGSGSGSFGSGMARPMGGNSGSARGGMSSSIPRIGFNNPAPRGGSSMRGGMGGHRGGGHHMGSMGRGGGMMGAPRGPGMRRRDDGNRGPPIGPRDRRGGGGAMEAPRDRGRDDRKRKDKVEKEAKTTMTDFRIVGIEVKELGWSWGLLGEHRADDQDSKEDGVKADNVKTEVDNVKAEDSAQEATEVKPDAKGQQNGDTEESDEKPDATENIATTTTEVDPKPEGEDSHDEKRGEKRKAKPSSIDGDEESQQSPKKRSSSTNNGPSEPTPVSSSESNQNRFRIYFESPPELDRVPKAARRNPNKRWRRESSSVAPSRVGDATQDYGEEDNEEDKGRENEHDQAHAGEERVGEGDGTEERKESDEAVPEAAAEAYPSEADVPAEGDVHGESSQVEAPVHVTDGSEGVSAEVAAETVDGAATEGTDLATVTHEAEEIGDISMATDATGLDAIDAPNQATDDNAKSSNAEATKDDSKEDTKDANQSKGLTGSEANQAELEAALAESAQNAASAYGTRNAKPRSRRWSTSSLESQAESVVTALAGDIPQPSVNRVSVLYEDSTRRLVFDASVVHKIRIFRGEGKIEVDLQSTHSTAKQTKDQSDEKPADGEEATTDPAVIELPKGVLVETYEPAEQRFVAMSRDKLDNVDDVTLPPLHKAFSLMKRSPVTLTVYLNKKKPLSEPKWCRTNQADEWLQEQFGRRAGADGGWRGKLEIMDPDAPPTLQAMLEQWKGGSNHGSHSDRSDFTASLLASPNDLLEILLRLTRGDRLSSANMGSSHSSANGPLATAIRADSPYASHQTHVSLAILAMYRLTTDYAQQAGVKTEVLNEQISDIIRSLPGHLILKSLDGLYKEWLAERKSNPDA